MLTFLELEPEIFGMEINDLSLRITKLKKRLDRYSIVSYNEVAIKPDIVKNSIIQDPKTLSDIIRSACSTVSGEKLKTKYVAISLPEEKSFSQVIQMPKMNDKELRSAVFFEAENYIPLPIDKVYLDFQVINTHNDDKMNHQDLLINVMPKPVVDSYVSCLKAAGLIPYILEVESQSIVRAMMKNWQKTSLPTLVVDLGVSSTSFIIFSGNSVRFTSSIPIISRQLTDAIALKLGISFAKAEELKIKYGLTNEGEKKYNLKKIMQPILKNLFLEIKKHINFYRSHASHEYLLSDKKSDKNISNLILCGGGANLKELPELLKNELHIPVEVGNPLINIDEQNNIYNQIILDKKTLSFTTALGLALRGLTEKNS